jgi:hypothetical protein
MGSRKLVNILRDAAQPDIDALLGPSDADVVTRVQHDPSGNGAGICWNLLTARAMPSNDKSFIIHKPKALAAGQATTSQAESVLDILTGKNQFEEYDLTNAYVSGSPTWSPDIWTLPSAYGEKGSAVWIDAGDQVLHLGLHKADLFGGSQLVVGNGRTADEKRWSIEVGSNSGRYPASFDAAADFAKGHAMVAWTDLHAAGETNAWNRSIFIARFDLKKPDTKTLTRTELEVPVETGHTSFSSVRLSSTSSGDTVVFATAGTPKAEVPAGNLSMKQATLLIGFTK